MMRVLIATNEPILAKGLESILVAGGLDVAGVAGAVFELFECLQNSIPDIVVLDMPFLNAPEVVQDLRRVAPKCQFVLWPRLGPDDSPDQLVDALYTISRYSPSATPSAEVRSICTAAERKMICLVGYGLNNDEIAAAMGYDRAAVQKILNSL